MVIRFQCAAISPMVNFLGILILTVTLTAAFIGSADARTVRVGVYDNKPLICLDEQDNAKGITVDLLRAIAAEENWDLEFIGCAWVECLNMLAAGQIDLQPAIIESPDRQKTMDFSRSSAITLWGRVHGHSHQIPKPVT